MLRCWTTALNSHLLQHQQLPHWDTVCLSWRLLSTAAAATSALQPAAQWHDSSSSSSSSRPTSSYPENPVNSNSSRASRSSRAAAGAARARVLDGKAVASAWSLELQQQVQELNRVLNRRPGLAVVLVGNRPDSLIYVTRKQEACRSIGIHCRVLRLPESVSQSDLQACVSEVSADRAIDGVLVQLPLPPHLDEEAIMEALDPRKDVDGFHPLNMGRMLMRGRAPRFVPATPLGVVELLSRSGVSLAGKTAVVLGDSNIVGTPIAALLRDAGVALVTTCHRVSLKDWFEHKARSQPFRAAAPDVCLPRLFGPQPPNEGGQHSTAQHAAAAAAAVAAHTASGQPGMLGQVEPQAECVLEAAEGSRFQPSHLPAICRTADILVVAVGSPELIKAGWVKPGAVVVDVGINVVPAPPRQQAVADQGLEAVTQPPQQQQQQQSAPSSKDGMQVPQGSIPTGNQNNNHHFQQQVLQQQQPSNTGSEGERSVVCKPQVQLNLVQSNADGSLSLSSEYSVVGDVAHEEVAQVASVVTPVPGGVGPMTIAAVLNNTLQAARYTAGLLRW